MGKKRKQLSQAEVWDDSALIQSWDDALEEYKLYHSIHARGERVEEVLREVGFEEEKVTEVNGVGLDGMTTAGKSNLAVPEDLEEGELEDEEGGQVQKTAIEQTPNQDGNALENAESASQRERPILRDTSAAAQSHGLPTIPTTILAGVQDDALKNLMMSWYYAGYYTGLYEGQEQSVAK